MAKEEQQTQEEQEQFFSCQECGGTGTGKMEFGCYKCQGKGVGLFFKGHFFFFDHRLSRPAIKFPVVKEKVDMIVDMAAFIVGVGGVASLAWWFFRVQDVQNIRTWQEIMFWNFKHDLLLMFWIGIAAFMFGFYKMKKERDEEYRIDTLSKVREEQVPDSWEEIKDQSRNYNVADALNRKSFRVLGEAYDIARKFKHKEITTFHLFAASLVMDKKVGALFGRLNVDQENLADKINRQFNQLPKADRRSTSPSAFSVEVKKALISSFKDAYQEGRISVEPLNMLPHCVENNETLKEILLDVKIGPGKIENVRSWFRINEEIRRNLERYRKMAQFKPKTNMDRAYTALATPFLNKCGYDMTLAAKWGRLEMCIARDKEIKKVFDSLSGSKNGVMLVGPEGVGKKTIVKGVARLMVKEEVPEFLQDKRMIELDVARLLSGADPSQAEERLLRVLDEVAQAGNIVLYIQDIENIIGITAGQEGSMDLSEVLVNGLSRRNIYCLTSTTSGSYYQHVEESSLARAMEVIEIQEPSGDQAVRIIEGKIGKLESRFKGVFFSYNAIEGALDLSSRYIHDKHLPTKAIDILEQTGVRLYKSLDKKETVICDKNDVAVTVKDMTNIPVDKVSEDEGKQLLNLEDNIHEYMIDQEEAVKVVANSLRRSRAELREEDRTIANFLFLGPTGVGKTELAKTVSQIYLGKKDFMFRLDMSEYQHADSIKKMIGESGGRKGHLTEAVRKNPFSLVLLDEFEKAHPKILDLFLQVMDDGRLTDAQGNTIDFTSTIIIATSNAGSKFIEQQISAGEDMQNIKDSLVNDKLMEVMKPELINRFDGVIIFKPLSMKHVTQIAELMIKDIDKMLRKKGMFLESTEQGLKNLAEQGYDPKFGARPLRRVLKKQVENKVAQKLLSGELERRDTVVINKDADIEVKKGKKL